MLESKRASGKDDINRTKYIFNSEHIIPPFLTQQQSKPAKLCHAENRDFARDLGSPFPSPWKSLGFEELEIKQEQLYNISAASPLTHTWAQQSRTELTCAHMAQLCPEPGQVLLQVPVVSSCKDATQICSTEKGVTGSHGPAEQNTGVGRADDSSSGTPRKSALGDCFGCRLDSNPLPPLAKARLICYKQGNH